MKKILTVLLSGILTLCLLASCSGASGDASTASSTAQSTANSTSKVAASVSSSTAQASDLDYIVGKGKMIIGYTVYAPMNFTDDAGVFTGFDTELATLVCAELGVEAEFVEINWDTKEMELEAGNLDCIWNGLTITQDRIDTMEITKPYVKNAQVVVMKSGAEYETTESLVGKAVCAEVGSAGESTILGDEFLAQAEYFGKPVQTECLLEVKSGTCDAAVLDLTLANAMIGEGTNYADLEIKERLAVEDYGVAFRKGSDVCAAVNNAFDKLKADGSMQDLASKYGLDLA
jgi:polar amino acid transport system substrate-binding protein